LNERDTAAPGPGPAKTAILILVIALLALEAAVHWWLLPMARISRLTTIGGLAEIAIWLLLFSVLVAVHLRHLPGHIYGLLTAGLAIWLSSQTADLMDEFLRQPLWLSIYGEDIARVCGMLLVTLGVLALIRHSANVMQKLEYMSLHDTLTGLCNRRRLQQQTAERGDASYSLLLLDLDHFKSVNDRHGHEGGDAMLRGLARVLQERFRSEGEIYRLGGEEFAILVEPLEPARLTELAEEVRDLVKSYRSSEGTSVSTSVGYGTRRRGEAPGALMRRIDKALYAAKHAGRDRAVAAD
jgi:diguanylate cyclase (GGDEF)-like protein